MLQCVLAVSALAIGACGQTPGPVTALEQAGALTAAGSYTAAEAAYREALLAAPDDPAPALGLAGLYLVWSRPEQGLASMNEAADRGASWLELTQQRLDLLRAAGRWDEVRSVTEDLLAEDASDLDVLAALVAAHLHLHQCPEAEAAARLHLDAIRGTINDAAPLSETSAQPAVTGEMPESLATSARVWGLLGNDATLLASADPDLTTGLPAQSPQRDLTLGLRLIRTGEWGLAACVLARVVNAPQPATLSAAESAQAEAWLGESLVRLGHAQQGEVHLRRAVDLAPESPLAWLLLGQHYLAQNSLDNARIALLNAQRLDPANPAPCLALAELKAAMGSYDEVDRWIDAALERAPDDPEITKAAARFYLSRWLEAGGAGLEIATQAVRLAPRDAETHTLLGWALIAEGATTAAAQALAEAIALDPGYAEAHYWLAVAFDRQGATVDATAARTRAADLGYPVEATTAKP